MNLPKDVLNIMLEYYGKIKYKNGKYINIIHKYDERYEIVNNIVINKIKICKLMCRSGKNRFYFEIDFEGIPGMCLCYDYGFNARDVFEICYVDLRNGWEQIRTYI
jgi:hypothetical protein